MDSTTLLTLVTSGYAVLDAFDLNPLKLIGQQLSPSITGKVKQELFGDPTYRNQLAKVVDGVLDQYRAEYGVTDRSRAVFFFQLQWTWDWVLAYRLFRANPPLQVADVPQLPGLVNPTQQELDEFDQRIQQAMAADPELRHRYYEENHKEITVQFALAAAQQLTRIENRLEQLPTAIHKVLDVLEKNTLEQYKPFTTLHLLQDIQPEVQRHPGDTGLQARLQYLLGRSYQETGNVEAAHEYYLQAYAGDSSNVAYAEQAALAYARLGMVAAAAEVVSHLKRLSPLNPVHYAVTLFLQAETLPEQLAHVPPSVARSEAFKMPLVDLLLQNKDAHLEKVQSVLRDDLDAYAPAAKLTFENRRFQVTLAQMVVHLEFDRLPLITQLDKVELLTDRPHLTLAYHTLQRYTQLLAATEKGPLLTHHYFVQGLAGFHLTGDIEELAEFGRRFDALPRAEKQGYAWQWACTLFRAQQHQRVLAVLDETDTTALPDAGYLRYHALFALEDARAKEALHHHLEQLASIDPISFDRVLRYLNGHCPDADERTAVVDACMARGQVDNPLVELLLRAEIAAQQEQGQEALARYLAQAETLVQDDTPAVYRQHLASLFQHGDDYARAADVMQGIEQAPGPQHPGGAIIRMRNQYHLYQDSAQLREALRQWRLQHGPILEFCSWEVELAHLLLDWDRVVEVTGALKDAVSAKTGARWIYMRALYQLERTQELQVALQEIAHRPELLTHDQLLAAAAMALHQGHADMALGMLYPLALNPEDVAARTRFFALYSQQDPVPQPEVGDVGTAVLYTLGTKRQRRLFLTEELREANPIAKQLIGMRAGDTAEVERGIRNKRVQLQVLEVTDFYAGLWRDIYHEIHQNESALPFESISFGSDTPTLEDITRTLVAFVGEGQRARQQFAKDVLGKYRRYEMTFFQVAVNLHEGNFLEAYHWLISGRTDAPGLVVPPLAALPPVEGLSERAIVLDWSSLPLLHTLHTDQGVPLPPSLWISRFVLEDLREQVRQKRRSKPERMSVEVIDGQLHPHVYPPEMHARQLAYLEGLLAWVETHCQRRYVAEKLDLLRQANLETDHKGQLINYAVDTAFLAGAEHAVLVSDDAHLLETAVKCGAGIMSTEAFLQAYYPSLYTTRLLPVLLDRSYIGLTIGAHALLQELRQAEYRFEDRAQHALRNMVQMVFFQPEHLQEMAHFVREMLTKAPLSPKQRRYLATKVLINGLFHTRLTQETFLHAAACLERAFWLLPSYADEAQNVLTTAWPLAALAQRNLRKKQ